MVHGFHCSLCDNGLTVFCLGDRYAGNPNANLLFGAGLLAMKHLRRDFCPCGLDEKAEGDEYVHVGTVPYDGFSSASVVRTWDAMTVNQTA